MRSQLRAVRDGVLRGEVSAREAVDRALELIGELDGPINAVVALRGDEARAEARSVDERIAAGDERRSAGGCSPPRQGPRGRGGDGDHPGVGAAARLAAGDRRLDCRVTPARRRCCRCRQEQPARVRHRGFHRQRAVRGDAQPVVAGPLARGIERWQRGRRGRGDGAARHGHGRWWLDPDPGSVLRSGRDSSRRTASSAAGRHRTGSTTRPRDRSPPRAARPAAAARARVGPGGGGPDRPAVVDGGDLRGAAAAFAIERFGPHGPLPPGSGVLDERRRPRSSRRPACTWNGSRPSRSSAAPTRTPTGSRSAPRSTSPGGGATGWSGVWPDAPGRAGLHGVGSGRRHRRLPGSTTPPVRLRAGAGRAAR